MTVEVWRFSRTGFGHENAALLHLARQLEPLGEHFLIIANPVLGGRELDGLILKHDMVFVVEFKKVCGPVTGTLCGPWAALQEDGTLLPLNEGREENPFQQVQHAYFAALNFLNANKGAFLTDSEAAVTDFKKIKNVLILDPEYDEQNSDIQLGKEAWKMIIVGLHNDVTDPFVAQRHEKINLTVEQMRIIARDVLCCHLNEDIIRLLHPESRAEVTPSQHIVLREPLDPAPEIHHQETVEARFDQPAMWHQSAVSLPPAVAQLKKASRAALNRAQETLKTVEEKIEGAQAQQYAAHRVDFEQLLDALRREAEKSLHHLPPNTYVANYYTVRLDPPAFVYIEALLERYQLQAEAQLYDYIEQEGYELEPKHKPLTVRIERNDDPKAPLMVVHPEYRPAKPVARIEGPQGQARDLFAGEVVLIGRGVRAEFRITDEHENPVISRQHCLIMVANDGNSVTVQDYPDAPSTNHLFVNGAQVSAATLVDGDIILLGRNKRGEEGPTLRVRFY